jgi:ATP-dependent Zn protease
MGIGRKTLFVSEKDKLNTAYHEGGHALTSLLTDGALPLHKVTILPVNLLKIERTSIRIYIFSTKRRRT